MFVVSQWSSLLAVLAVPLLVWFLLATRPSLRRAAFLSALAATVALVVLLVAVVVYVQSRFLPQSADLYWVVTSVLRFSERLTDLLAFAAWAFLLAAAAQANDRRRLAVLAVVFALALTVQIAANDTQVPLLAWERQLASLASRRDLALGASIDAVFMHIAAIPALLCAMLAPADPATPPAGTSATSAS